MFNVNILGKMLPTLSHVEEESKFISHKPLLAYVVSYFPYPAGVCPLCSCFVLPHGHSSLMTNYGSRFLLYEVYWRQKALRSFHINLAKRFCANIITTYISVYHKQLHNGFTTTLLNPINKIFLYEKSAQKITFTSSFNILRS